MILSSFYYEVLQECCPVKTSQEHGSSLAFFDKKKKAQLPAIRITKQPIPITKRKIKTDSVQSLSNTCKNFSLKIYSQHSNFLNAI